MFEKSYVTVLKLDRKMALALRVSEGDVTPLQCLG